MQQEINIPVMAIVNDLDALITEIDENPHISSWVVRLILKSIKDKARNAVFETAPIETSPNQLVCKSALENTFTVVKIRSQK